MFRLLADIRRGELGRAALAFAVLLLVVGSHTLVKAVRDAVFLSRFSVTELSLVSIGLAALSGVIVSVTLRSTSGIARNRLVIGTHLAVAASLLAIAGGLHGAPGARWLPWVLYGWSSVFGVFIVAQFWLVAGDLFDLREARRLFGPIGFGGVAGGLTGGVIARVLAMQVGASGLLAIASAMLVVAAVATGALWKRRRLEVRSLALAPAAAPPARVRDLLARPSYLRLLAVGLILGTVATTLLDWQLKAVAKHALDSRADELAAFFGSVHAALSAGSVVLQLAIAPWLFRRYGVGVGRASLPAVLLIGLVAVAGQVFLPLSALVLLTGARVVEGATRFAIHQPAVELSWLPLPAAQRNAAKPLVDTVGDRIGTGLAGLVWIGLAALSLDRPDRIHWTALAAIAIALLWLVVCARIDRAYVDQMRAALAQRSIDLDSLRRSLGDAETRQVIVDSLASGDVGRIRFALYLLERWDRALPHLSAPLRHPRADVRIQALRLLADKASPEQRELAADSLADADIEVCEAAVGYLRATAPDGDDPVVAGLSAGESRASVVRWLIAPERTDPSAAAAAIAGANGEARLALIRLLGASHSDRSAALLAPLLDDPDDRVVEAAVRAAGRARVAALVPALAHMLAEPGRRAAVVSALTDIGLAALAPLIPIMRDDGAQPEVRRAVIRLAGSAGDAAIVPALVALLDDRDPDIAGEALRALSRVRTREPVAIDAATVRARLIEESIGLGRELLFLDRGAWPQARDAEPDDFVDRSVRDAANARVDRMFRLLGLIHDPADVQSAYRGLRSSLRSTRSSSIEFLDNLVHPALRRVLIAPLDDADRDRFAEVASGALGLARLPRERALAGMIGGADPWLRQVATWSARADEENKTMGLSLVEKALELGTVDVLGRVPSEDLAYIAQLAEEIELAPGAPIYMTGDAPDALYVILRGSVRLFQDRDEIGVLGQGEAFGSWALFDDAPRVASAIADGQVTVLKVDREQFLELLGDRMGITRAIFRAMVERIRSLAELAQQR